MRRTTRRDAGPRFWVEAAIGWLCAGLSLLTVVWHDWIEAFGVEPDGGDGSLEWAVVGVLALLAIVSGLLARRDWLRAQPAS